jgi:uncharacterized protein VirK/YbjX
VYRSLTIHPFLQLARQRHYWSPSRLARIAWAVARHIRQQREILQVLSIPLFQKLVFTHPELPFKYLSRDYLARDLTAVDRASCFTHHYRRLGAAIPSRMLREVLRGGAVLMEKTEGENHYAIVLGLVRTEVREGELFLQLRVNGEIVYVLQFTMVPGNVVGSAAKEALLISRLQGMKGCYKQIHAATRAFRDVAPPALLLAVLQGFAKAVGIRELAAVSATSQFSYTPEYAASFVEAYDDFFTEMGATRSSGIFFSSPIPLEERPVESNHKARTRKKRIFRLEITENISQTILNSL